MLLGGATSLSIVSCNKTLGELKDEKPEPETFDDIAVAIRL